MEWTDEGIVLSARPHGETAVIATLLTRAHGCHAGLISGGQSRRRNGIAEIGTHVAARWSARLPDHLGRFALEPLAPLAAPWFNEPEVLALIASGAAVLESSLPERQPMPRLFDSFLALLSLEDETLWAPAYIRWEMGVLEALGYGLDLSCCALTGAREGLAFISPRTGRAVTREAAAPYEEKLLPLPAFLCGKSRWSARDILHGLDLTGHFLCRHVFSHPQSRRLLPIDGQAPVARLRLASFYQGKLKGEQDDEAAVA